MSPDRGSMSLGDNRTGLSRRGFGERGSNSDHLSADRSASIDHPTNSKGTSRHGNGPVARTSVLAGSTRPYAAFYGQGDVHSPQSEAEPPTLHHRSRQGRPVSSPLCPTAGNPSSAVLGDPRIWRNGFQRHAPLGSIPREYLDQVGAPSTASVGKAV